MITEITPEVRKKIKRQINEQIEGTVRELRKNIFFVSIDSECREYRGINYKIGINGKAKYERDRRGRERLKILEVWAVVERCGNSEEIAKILEDEFENHEWLWADTMIMKPLDSIKAHIEIADREARAHIDWLLDKLPKEIDEKIKRFKEIKKKIQALSKKK